MTRLSVEGGYLNVTALTTKRVVEIDPELQRMLLAGGYEILSHDNEGFEAEIIFSRDDTVGTFTLREGPCDGQVTAHLLYGDERYER